MIEACSCTLCEVKTRGSSHCKWRIQWARFKECFEGLCQTGKLYYTFPRRIKACMKHRFLSFAICICVCMQLCNAYRETILWDTTCIATCSDTFT